MRAAALALVPAVALLAGCGGSPGPERTEQRTVTVLAASSLATVMTTLTGEYERAHPGVQVKVTTGGSSDLVAQLAGGLPADVLATADQRTMTTAADQGLVAAPVAVATNTLTLVTAPGNPLHLRSLADAARHDLWPTPAHRLRPSGSPAAVAAARIGEVRKCTCGYAAGASSEYSSVKSFSRARA